MAPMETALATRTPVQSNLDPAQILRATTALLFKIQSDGIARKNTATPTTPATTKPQSLLADADGEPDAENELPIWLVLTTKKHIVDAKRLKPGKILLPHPYLSTTQEPALRICLITADPQRKYKDLIEHPSFPAELKKRITRVLGIEKVEARYKSFESRRQLLGEYDIFLADDRVITYLPHLLGKVFYKGGSKRPIPVDLQGKRQSVDEQGNKRRKLSEGGTKAVKWEVRPQDVAREVERAVRSALVHLAPSSTTAVKVGTAGMEAGQLRENVEVVVDGLVGKWVSGGWKGVRSVHVKGPNTAALPIWMAGELWGDEGDVLDEAPVKSDKKRKRSALGEGAGEMAVIEVPGPDGKMRRLEAPGAKKSAVNGDKVETKPAKKSNSDVVDDDSAAAKAVEKSEKKARKEALAQQKEAAKKTATSGTEPEAAVTANGDGKKAVAKKARTKAADLI
ncbi:proteasome-interacting protein cic1 [Friedmanniomyces endolithicus]|nr:proteasome-interacting protein cic1 [Friedmanniomyces endolithicus]KAK1817436.1 proteasome-interacting protein cic1 [Friedmanniomyces endolithicus]